MEKIFKKFNSIFLFADEDVGIQNGEVIYPRAYGSFREEPALEKDY